MYCFSYHGFSNTEFWFLLPGFTDTSQCSGCFNVNTGLTCRMSPDKPHYQLCKLTFFKSCPDFLKQTKVCCINVWEET